MIQASDFALNQNHALLENFHLLQPNPNHPKKPLYFMKGDPTEFGHEFCKMDPRGYEYIKESIRLPSSHSYCHSAGTTNAREAIVKHFNYGKSITVNDVIIASGVNQGLLYALWAACDPGSNILVPEIGYPFYNSIAPAYGVEVRKYKLLQEKNWEIDLEDLQSKVDTKTSFMLVINPSNPCGSVFSKQHVKDVLKWAEDNCLLIVADEVYYGMSFTEFHSFGEYAEEGPVICLSGMEKLFFVPGWQTSWIIFYDKNKYAEQIKQAFFNIIQLLLHSNVFIMNALPHILDDLTINYGKDRCCHFKKNHDYLVEQFKNIRGMNCPPAQGAFYLPILLDLKMFNFENDTEFAQKLLEEENVMLLPLSWNGTDRYQGFRMLTIATQEIYADMMDRIKQFVVRHYKS